MTMNLSKITRTSSGRISHALTLGEVVEQLLVYEIITTLDAENILKNYSKSLAHPFATLSECQLKDKNNHNRPLSMERITEWYSTICQIPYLRIDSLKINMEQIVNIVPYAYLTRLNIIPVEVDKNSITFATSQPYLLDWISEVSSVTKKKVEVRLSSPSTIKLVLDDFYVVQRTLKKMGDSRPIEQQKLIKQGKFEELDLLLELSKQKNFGDMDSTIVKIVDWLITYANNEKASDIHLEPKRGRGHIRFRVDGILQVVYKMDPEAMLSVISRLKILSEMKVDEKRKPQDGRIKHFLGNGSKLEMRVSVIPTYYGEKMVLRIFDQKVAQKDLSFVGLSPEDKKTWDKLIHNDQGLILVTGPTGSGKTTTLYTTLNIVATPEVNICTVEDPIEMTIESFNQMQVNTSLGLTFAEAVRAFLRQDPDILMVGEIRDSETADAAIQASLTGHLVFSTLHTNGALATIQRLLDLNLPSFLINSSLKAILAQRLVRKLCEHCRQKTETPIEAWKYLVDDLQVEMPSHIYEAEGCPECKHTGYRGRICVYELVELTEKIKKNIKDGVEISELKEKTRGMYVPFRFNCILKILEGETSIQEILTVVY